jgi:uncharacterized membrane protein
VSTSQRTRPSAPPVAGRGPAAPASRAVPAAILVLALAGLGVAIDLWVLHHRAHAGGTAFCDISDTVSCSKVALSPYAVFLGVPTAAWGALAYLAVAGLAATALGRRRPGPAWPGGLLLILTGLMSLGAVALAAVSELVIHAFCIMCSVSWALSFALLGLSVALARRAGGARAAIRADLEALRAGRRAARAGAAGLAAAAVALLAVYALAPPQGAPAAKLPTDLAAIPRGEPGSLVIYEFSDYLCPHCAVMHQEERSILARRPDVRFVRRFFPLDASCNPRLPTTIHPGSCDLARGGICAERLGRFEPYDDLAFATQNASPGPEKLAQQVGLDLGAFRDCMAAPETDRRLASDIQFGAQANVTFTPALQIQGKIYSKELVPALLGLDQKKK